VSFIHEVPEKFPHTDSPILGLDEKFFMKIYYVNILERARIHFAIFIETNVEYENGKHKVKSFYWFILIKLQQNSSIALSLIIL
jgi:hypothetical protein